MEPSVSIVVPTFNRRKFIPLLLRYFAQQTYPQQQMELILADDGSEPIEDLLAESRYYTPENAKNSAIRYYRLENKLTIGKKRNLLNDLARGQFILAMDDDDWYGPEYVQAMVKTLKSTDKLICGSSKVFCYFTQLNRILQLGPFGDNHTGNHLMGYKKEYLKNHRYDETKTLSEEASFTNGFTEPMAQISNPERVFLLISHADNSMDRLKLLQHSGLLVDIKRRQVVTTSLYEKIKKQNTASASLSDLKLGNIIKDKVARTFYKELGNS